jgi:hypothetical protein
MTASMGTTAYAGPLLQGFGAGATVDLRDITAVGATMTYTAATGVLQIANGTQHASLHFDIASLGSGSFHLGNDGTGHVLLTRS